MKTVRLIVLGIMMVSVVSASDSTKTKYTGEVRFSHGYGHLMIGYDCNEAPNSLTAYVQEVLKWAVVDVVFGKGNSVVTRISEGISNRKLHEVKLYYSCSEEGKVSKFYLTGNADMLIKLFVRYWQGYVEIGANKAGLVADQHIGNEVIKLQLKGPGLPATINVVNNTKVL